MPRACLALLAALATAAEKPPPTGRASNDAVDVQATLYASKAHVQGLLGNDLGGYYIVVDVRLTPKSKLAIWRDDFLLRSDRDGERSKPYAPSQIAGKGALVVSQTGGGSVMADNNRGPVWGGYPTGRPSRIGGDGAVLGNSSAVTNQSSVRDGSKEKPNPLLDVLTAKALAEKESDQAASGLLYFPLEPKQKPKDVELIYQTPAGKLSVRFR
ncbi:MAG: hypothetical protein ACRD96_26620 [Bryobacteraceae bacterium]